MGGGGGSAPARGYELQEPALGTWPGIGGNSGRCFAGGDTVDSVVVGFVDNRFGVGTGLGGTSFVGARNFGGCFVGEDSVDSVVGLNMCFVGACSVVAGTSLGGTSFVVVDFAYTDFAGRDFGVACFGDKSFADRDFVVGYFGDNFEGMYFVGSCFADANCEVGRMEGRWVDWRAVEKSVRGDNPVGKHVVMLGAGSHYRVEIEVRSNGWVDILADRDVGENFAASLVNNLVGA